ncbi:non-ribosomal peptide synthetase, partial [Streptomyces sp. KLOTTS4A1]|uniref:non-ribosomal peptide synthetase n=1 Tax=Streptomyces sp. KLOTTS4A1 TaxID=3390996 RepID=UPI0039F603EA
IANPTRTLAHHPLFQVMLVLQNNAEAGIELGGFPARVDDLTVGTAKFDLSFTLHECHTAEGTPAGLNGFLTYATDLFERNTVETLVARLVRFLDAVAADADRPVRSVDVLAPEERADLLGAWSASPQEIAEASFVELFEEQVARGPQAVAVEFGDVSLSYAELNGRANQLARWLVERGAGPEARVAVALPRSVEWLVAILAVMKTGGAYVPVDPEYPADRIAYMLDNSDPVTVLTCAETAPELPAGVLPFLVEDIPLDAYESGDLSDEDRTGPLLAQSPAYVIHTSGSTGRPKGVVVTHTGIAGLAHAQIHTLGVDAGSRVLQFASPSFDAASWEVVMALLSGARLVLATATELMPGEPLADVLARHHITHATLPPTALTVLPDHALPDGMTLIVAGEACPPAMVEKWSTGRRMINAYGPTETTVCATMSQPLTGPVTPPIGTPLTNTQVYVLDAALQPVPVGVPGEL